LVKFGGWGLGVGVRGGGGGKGEDQPLGRVWYFSPGKKYPST